jgi:hypothetical protein
MQKKVPQALHVVGSHFETYQTHLDVFIIGLKNRLDLEFNCLTT